jgi:hypothetical protein
MKLKEKKMREWKKRANLKRKKQRNEEVKLH